MFAKSPIKRRGRERFLRNCCIAAGNTKNKKYIKNLDKLIDNENSKIILVASRWAKKQLIIC